MKRFLRICVGAALSLGLSGCFAIVQNPEESCFFCVQSCRFCCDPTFGSSFANDEAGRAAMEAGVSRGAIRAMAY